MLSQLVSELKPSPTLALASKAKELKAQGHDVISLTVGEPDWETYAKAKEAGKEAIESGQTRYTPASGTPELRKAIAGMINSQIGTDYEFTQVTVTSGAKFILFSALSTLLDPEDEIIIPAPYWVSYTAMANLCRAKSVIVEGQEANGFKITADQFKTAITDKTKVFLLNSPSNPTGMVYSKQELSEIAEVLKANPKVVVLSDDIYNQLSFNEDKFAPHLLQVAPELKDRVVCVNGVSKAYAMTGWRIGWATGPKEIISGMTNFQSQALGCSSSVSQAASLAAIQYTQNDINLALETLSQRRSFGLECLNEVDGFDLQTPEGAFYFWVSIKDVLAKSGLEDSRAYSQKLLEEHNVVVVPGQEFGMDGFIRLSYAVPNESMKQAADRFSEFHKNIMK